MALKPFYNKKGHLGMTRQQVKAALENGGKTEFVVVTDEEQEFPGKLKKYFRYFEDDIDLSGGQTIHGGFFNYKTDYLIDDAKINDTYTIPNMRLRINSADMAEILTNGNKTYLYEHYPIFPINVEGDRLKSSDYVQLILDLGYDNYSVIPTFMAEASPLTYASSDFYFTDLSATIKITIQFYIADNEVKIGFSTIP